MLKLSIATWGELSAESRLSHFLSKPSKSVNQVSELSDEVKTKIRKETPIKVLNPWAAVTKYINITCTEGLGFRSERECKREWQPTAWTKWCNIKEGREHNTEKGDRDCTLKCGVIPWWVYASCLLPSLHSAPQQFHLLNSPSSLRELRTLQLLSMLSLPRASNISLPLFLEDSLKEVRDLKHALVS